MDKTREAIQAGTYEMPLFSCEIRQCDAESPIIYTGPGLVCQDADKRLVIKVFAGGTDYLEQIKRDFNRPFLPGKLVPDSGYYDLTGVDLSGDEWVSKHISIDTSSGSTGTLITAVPHLLEKVQINDTPYTKSSVHAFIPGKIELPWHVYTQTANGGATLDRFEGGTDLFSWKLRKKDDGTEVHFIAQAGEVQNAFTEFRRALAVLTGHHLRMEVITIYEDNKWITRLHNTYWEPDDAKLLTPIRISLFDEGNAHVFLCAYMRHATSADNHGRLIYQLWHRILRARENDIENSALVLSVAIEGLIKGAFADKHGVDAAFLAEVNAAKPALEALPVGDRVKNAITNSLENAARPSAKAVLHGLTDQGAISKAHLKAWKGLRNTSAHGDSLVDDGLQKHLDRFHTCLNLFYRLVFLVIGYQGKQKDYSLPGWPETAFPPTSATTNTALLPAPTSSPEIPA